MILKSIISVFLASSCLIQCLAQNTPKTESNVVTTLLVSICQKFKKNVTAASFSNQNTT